MADTDRPRVQVLRGEPDDAEIAAVVLALSTPQQSEVDTAVPAATGRWQVFGYRPPTAWSAPQPTW